FRRYNRRCCEREDRAVAASLCEARPPQAIHEARYVAHRATATDSLLLQVLSVGRRRRRRPQALMAVVRRVSNASAVLPRWVVRRECAGQSDREKIVSFRKGAGDREFRRGR